MDQRRIVLLPALLALSLGLAACKKPVAEGYRVTGYDGATKQWTIIRNGTFDGRYLTKKLVVVCSFYKWGDREPDRGPEACHLAVGRLIVPNPLPGPSQAADFVDVDESVLETLSITEGAGQNQTMQQFNILKYEVLTDEPAK